MEKMVVTNTNLSIRILYWVVEIHSFFSKFHLYLENLVANALTRWKFWTKVAMSENLLEDEKLSESDVKKVMDELGVAYNPDSDTIDQERIGAHELSQLFDEEQPSLEEVKEAFEVFDENKDGFIGATELQRVLRSLGLKEGSEIEECTKMIRAVDENGDGLIDFNEFLKFMENCSY